MRTVIFILLNLYLTLSADDRTNVTVLFTNNINGNFENCLCADHPLGSLEKMRVVIDSIRQHESNVLLLDAGDFSSPFGDTLRDRYLYEIGALIGYDAMAVGDQEFSNGVDFFNKNRSRTNLPFISANLKIDQKNSFPSYIIKQYGQIKILIIAAIFEDVFKFYDQQLISRLKLADPVESIHKIIAQNTADLIILLSHNGLDNDKLLTQKIPGVHIIIGAHTQDFLENPVRSGKSSIFQAGSDGFYLGKIELYFMDAEFDSFHYQAIPMKLDLRNDPGVAELIKQYYFEKNEPIITKGSYLNPISKDFAIQSAEHCRSCHSEEYQHWLGSGHAVSFQTIEKEGKTKLLKCLSCHVSGFGRKEGFVNLNITPHLNSVNCTECHYLKSGHEIHPETTKPIKISIQTCVRCHDLENDPDFNFETSFKLISHKR